MTNLTIAVDDEALKRARIRALGEGTSVNALLKDYLNTYAGLNSAQIKAANEILRLSKASRSRRGTRKWNRDELHERR